MRRAGAMARACRLRAPRVRASRLAGRFCRGVRGSVVVGVARHERSRRRPRRSRPPGCLALRRLAIELAPPAPRVRRSARRGGRVFPDLGRPALASRGPSVVGARGGSGFVIAAAAGAPRPAFERIDLAAARSPAICRLRRLRDLAAILRTMIRDDRGRVGDRRCALGSDRGGVQSRTRRASCGSCCSAPRRGRRRRLFRDRRLARRPSRPPPTLALVMTALAFCRAAAGACTPLICSRARSDHRLPHTILVDGRAVRARRAAAAPPDLRGVAPRGGAGGAPPCGDVSWCSRWSGGALAWRCGRTWCCRRPRSRCFVREFEGILLDAITGAALSGRAGSTTAPRLHSVPARGAARR